MFRKDTQHTCFNDVRMVWKAEIVVGAKVQNCVWPPSYPNSYTLVMRKLTMMVTIISILMIVTWAVLNTLSVFQVPAWRIDIKECNHCPPHQKYQLWSRPPDELPPCLPPACCWVPPLLLTETWSFWFDFLVWELFPKGQNMINNSRSEPFGPFGIELHLSESQIC